MALLLGIDTGGTYTDAVLVDPASHPGVLGKAKALTTRQDLSIGIGEAITHILADGARNDDVGLVSVSTTLATNALVEGLGRRCLLVLVGFEEEALERAGLGAALGSDPVAFIAGGHTPTGERQAPLDLVALDRTLSTHKDSVDAVAVVAYFGTRDPSDEITTRDRIHAATGLPVTCGHELSASLNGPRRALTALLNARLIGMISELIDATETVIARHDITAPLMLVRGDGSLVSAAFARHRPIETILSGPAASLVGAAHLTGLPDAVVSDIGGTTTDIAILRSGKPASAPDGAMVGGHHTMVAGVDMVTHGLGGDSEVLVDDTSMLVRLKLGPRRVTPISLLAETHGEIVHAALDRQLRQSRPGTLDARFARRAESRATTAGLKPLEDAMLSELGPEPCPVADIATTRPRSSALGQLVSRGLAEIAGFTPSDAAHVAGLHDSWDGNAAEKAATLMARQRTASGQPAARDGKEFARMTMDALATRSAHVLLEASLRADGVDGVTAAHPLVQHALAGHSGATRIDIGLALPLIGLGASASVHYPAIAQRLGAVAHIPEDADVANAIGAVVGHVSILREATVTQPAEGCFRAHLTTGQQDFTSEDRARDETLRILSQQAQAAAIDAGADDVQLETEWTPVTAKVEGKALFVEAIARVRATGRPKVAT